MLQYLYLCSSLPTSNLVPWSLECILSFVVCLSMQGFLESFEVREGHRGFFWLKFPLRVPPIVVHPAISSPLCLLGESFSMLLHAARFNTLAPRTSAQSRFRSNVFRYITRTEFQCSRPPRICHFCHMFLSPHQKPSTPFIRSRVASSHNASMDFCHERLTSRRSSSHFAVHGHI